MSWTGTSSLAEYDSMSIACGGSDLGTTTVRKPRVMKVSKIALFPSKAKT